MGDFLKINKEVFTQDKTPSIIKNPVQYPDKFLNELKVYRDAYIAYQMNGDEKKALEIIKTICAKDQNDAHVNIQGAFLAIKNKKYEMAREYLSYTTNMPLTKNMSECRDLFYGILEDILGNHEEAKDKYRNLIHADAKRIRDYAHKLSSSKGSEKYLSSIMLDMQFPEPIEY